MKTFCTLLIVAMSFWTNGVDAQYTTTRIGNYSYTSGPGTNVTSTRIRDPLEPVAKFGSVVQLTIQNNRFNDATIYAEWSGIGRRLVGRVTGKTSETFIFDLESHRIRIKAEFIAGGRFTTDEIGVSGGDHLELVILTYVYSNGTVGNSSYNTTTTRIGNYGYTSGRVGSSRISGSSTSIGSYGYGNGSIGSSWYNTSTTRIGNSSYTSGRVGSTRINATSQRIGQTTYTSVRPRIRRW